MRVHAVGALRRPLQLVQVQRGAVTHLRGGRLDGWVGGKERCRRRGGTCHQHELEPQERIASPATALSAPSHRPTTGTQPHLVIVVEQGALEQHDDAVAQLGAVCAKAGEAGERGGAHRRVL